MAGSPRILLPFDVDYPASLRSLKKAPELTVVGNFDPRTDAKRVAIVGARFAHSSALAYAEQLAMTLCRSGVCVVSGGALGVDGAAHRGALAAGGVTWVVAPFGLGAPCFPPKHAGLFADVVAKRGAIVHVVAAGEPARAHFTVRNRWMVAMVDAVVVVQAGRSSGTLNTARHAVEQRRPLWVASPPPWIDGFEGSIDLLRAGDARTLWRTEELVEEVVAPLTTPEDLDSEGEQLWSCLEDPRHRDELAHATGWSSARLANVIFGLELRGLVYEDDAGRLHRNRQKTPRTARRATT